MENNLFFLIKGKLFRMEWCMDGNGDRNVPYDFKIKAYLNDCGDMDL